MSSSPASSPLSQDSQFTVISSNPEPSAYELTYTPFINIIYTRHRTLTAGTVCYTSHSTHRTLTAGTVTFHTALTERYKMPSKHPSIVMTKANLLLNKLLLCSLTQHRFISIQTVTFTCVLHVSACTYAFLRHVNIIIL